MADDALQFTIRPARLSDSKAIFSLIRGHADRLIVRSLSNVIEHIDRFFVAENAAGEIVATVAYEIMAEIGEIAHTTAEIQSLCVREDLRGRGVGRALVTRQMERLRAMQVRQIISLTFEVGFFEALGFKEIDKREIMHKLYRGCINCSKHESPFTCPEHAMELCLDA